MIERMTLLVGAVLVAVTLWNVYLGFVLTWLFVLVMGIYIRQCFRSAERVSQTDQIDELLKPLYEELHRRELEELAREAVASHSRENSSLRRGKYITADDKEKLKEENSRHSFL